MDADVIVAMMMFIPAVDWHAGIWAILLERLYNAALECFDRSSGRPVVRKLRDKVYLSGETLFHLAILRKCIGDESDKAVFKSISSRHPVMGSKHYGEDSGLESTLDITDQVFNDFDPMYWQNLSVFRSTLRVDGTYPPVPCLGCPQEMRGFA